MRRFFLVAAAMCGAAAGAQAADLPFLRGSFTEGLTRSSVSWQGYYFGGQASYGSVNSRVASDINSDLQSTFLPPPGIGYTWRPLANAHSNPTGYGAFAGYNSQWEDVVVGIEVNYIRDGIASVTKSAGLRYEADNVTIQSVTDSNVTVRLSDFGSLRVRGGYIMGNFLPYLFAGAGLGSQTLDRGVSAFPNPVRPTSGTATATKTKLVYGYSAGAGVDVMLLSGLFLRAEYEYRRVASDVETNINTVRAGLGYKF
ncbi:outer membrane beta-barrel protein [Bradyrhizobium sp.]|uniref:outer membrane protein n=1 Tax=Bradyrhizobium sp. TaxID=376 RepID=UPI0025C26861|nr:outer membrane beta-barrel protein [Bradyrhizobium sp.]